MTQKEYKNEMRIVDGKLVTGHVNRNGVFVDIRPVKIGPQCELQRESDKMATVSLETVAVCQSIDGVPGMSYRYNTPHFGRAFDVLLPVKEIYNLNKCGYGKVILDVQFECPILDVMVVEIRAADLEKANSDYIERYKQEKEREEYYYSKLNDVFEELYKIRPKQCRRMYSGEPSPEFKALFKEKLKEIGFVVYYSQQTEYNFKKFMKDKLNDKK
jgi:hypothetical protein